MVDKRSEELSLAELRRLMLEKSRIQHHERLENFRRTGRAITVSPLTGTWSSLESAEKPAQPAEDQPLKTGPARKSWLSNLLLAIEILAVLVLAGLIVNGFSVLRTLNREVISAIQLPTPAATALITAVVLPSGHTPPNSAQGAQPNDAEIPEHLRPLVASIQNLPIPTTGPTQAIRIQIPALQVDAPIVQGDGWEQLKKGVAQHLGTPDPGQDGNIVLSAHDDVFGEIFRYLDKLQSGDVIILFTSTHQYTYVVTGTQYVEPTQVEVMAPTAQPVVTLISCYPYMIDNRRIVVSAELQKP